MGKDKLSDILARHLVADVQIKHVYFDEDDPRSYADRITGLTAQGSMFLQRGMHYEALIYLHRALLDRKDNFWATFYIGSIALELNKPDLANYYLRACLEAAPEDWAVRPLLLTNYSCIQFKLGDFEGAEASLEEARRINPDLDRPYYMGAIHKIYRGQYKEAHELIRMGLEESPESRLLKHLDLDIQEIIENL